MYDYNCPDCDEMKLQSDKNARKINEVIEQVNALIQVNNETVDFIEEKAYEIIRNGLVIESPNGTQYKIIVTDDGLLYTERI